MAEDERPRMEARNIMLAPQHMEALDAIATRRKISFSEATRRVLDQWMDMRKDGVVAEP